MVKADPWYNTRLDVVDLDELEGDWDAETLYSNSHPVLLDMNFNELLREQQVAFRSLESLLESDEIQYEIESFLAYLV